MLNGRTIREKRLGRGWSQEQLASVSGLGLRTIQRIETDGSCSLESQQALAAVLENPLSELTDNAHIPPASAKKREFDDQDLSNFTFSNVNLAEAAFSNVNLHASHFNNIRLSNAKFHNVSLANVEITNADISGLKINGVLISELFANQAK
ncbi:pentapeptide repeat-containing protein [Veronia pacifica]|uniref:HTH cro/C1-type domain-containing protein n=1 Tax=Veronia pacifica TaxID=1080227 RepID=A0A1C3ECD4_9GAMM|nr:pentapeptide repeat-containing protein [Veronia pacifica]ODA30916.1 hypothetical protein A8L45_18760 [Veronia pacifica]